jgi:fibronectin type 3 domain-containing protein
VVAIDQAGNRSDPVSAAVTTPDDTAAPSKPSGLTAKAAGNPRRVELSWSASTDDVAVTGYQVYRDGVVIATVGVTSYTDTSVTRSTRYRYTVSALDATGNESALSSTVKVRTR